MLNVSSRVFWLELDDKPLLDSYAVLQRASFVMCFRRSVLLRGRVLEGKGLQLLSCGQAVKMRMTGLNFHVIAEEPMAYLYTRGTLTEEVSEQVFSKERRRLQAKHLWMEVKLRWRGAC